MCRAVAVGLKGPFKSAPFSTLDDAIAVVCKEDFLNSGCLCLPPGSHSKEAICYRGDLLVKFASINKPGWESTPPAAAARMGEKKQPQWWNRSVLGVYFHSF